MKIIPVPQGLVYFVLREVEVSTLGSSEVGTCFGCLHMIQGLDPAQDQFDFNDDRPLALRLHSGATCSSTPTITVTKWPP